MSPVVPSTGCSPVSRALAMLVADQTKRDVESVVGASENV